MIRYLQFTKTFDGHTAVDGLTAEVPAGATVALLGPNGSGKTTTIKAAAGLIRPSSGEVLLGTAGKPAGDPAARQACSFLPQRVGFPDALTGREVVEFYRRLRGVNREATERVLRMASLNGASSRAVSTYSGGMVQRLGLAVAMLPDADVLLLDEPTAALDPDGLSAFYDLIDERRRAGRTVFFSSHQLGDVERLADRILVLVAGRLAASLSGAALAARLASRGTLVVRLSSRVPGLLDRVRELSPGADWTEGVLRVPGPASTRLGAIDLIRAAGGVIESLTTEEGRLDGFYRDVVGGAS